MRVWANLSPVDAVLAAIAYLLIKHWVADFLLQTKAQRHQKGTYGALGGITHALTHIALTAPVFLILTGIGGRTIALLLAAEFIIHYHIDWAKETLVRVKGWTVRDAAFWWTIGFDQMLHGLTYVAIVWAAVHGI